jgi:hypothetical protein
MEVPMKRALVGFALFASFAASSSRVAAQETKPSEPAPAPAPAPPPPAPPSSEPMAIPPEPPPFVASGDVALNPVTDEPETPGPRKRRLVFAAALGYTSGGSVKHPELSGNGFSGEMLELAAGIELNPKWHLVLAFTSFQTKLERVGVANQFRSASAAFHGSGYQPLVSCPDCIGAGGQGGVVTKQPFHVNTLGPRLDYLPFGSDSVYIGATAGAAMMQDLSFRGGVAVAARAGFEWRPYSAIGFSLEAGAHGSVYSDSSAILPYAAIQMRLLAPMPSVSRFTTVTNEPGPTPPPAQHLAPPPYR